MDCGMHHWKMSVITPYRNCRSGTNISRKVESGFPGFLIYENDFAVVQLTWWTDFWGLESMFFCKFRTLVSFQFSFNLSLYFNFFVYEGRTVNKWMHVGEFENNLVWKLWMFPLMTSIMHYSVINMSLL